MKKKRPDYNEMSVNGVSITRARELLKLKRATINDFEVIRDRTYEYLSYCDTDDRVPTLRGLGVCLGISSDTINKWIVEKPNHETSIFLAQVVNLMADNLEQGALKGTMDRNASVFLLKSNFGYRDNQDVKIHHIVSDSKSIEQIEKEISAGIIDVEFEEKWAKKRARFFYYTLHA